MKVDITKHFRNKVECFSKWIVYFEHLLTYLTPYTLKFSPFLFQRFISIHNLLITIPFHSWNIRLACFILAFNVSLLQTPSTKRQNTVQEISFLAASNCKTQWKKYALKGWNQTWSIWFQVSPAECFDNQAVINTFWNMKDKKSPPLKISNARKQFAFSLKKKCTKCTHFLPFPSWRRTFASNLKKDNYHD